MIVPIYTEPREVIDDAVASLVNTEYLYRENIVILLATEERASEAKKHAEFVIEKYKNQNIEIINIVHPANLPGEGKVK